MPIRRGAFETNSSSMHSIVMTGIMPGDILDIPSPDENGEIVVAGTWKFGWGYEEYNDFRSKVAYFIIDNIDYVERMNMLFDVIKKFTKGDLVHEVDGYIDHQSVGTTCEKIKTEQDLVAFLFKPETQLIIDNDNH